MSGDTFDGAIKLQFEMFGKKDGTETARTEHGDNSIFAGQDKFFYARSAPFTA